MASPDPKVKESQFTKFQQEEEAWFSDRSRESKRLLRTSPTTPPPPMGDDEVDSWLR